MNDKHDTTQEARPRLMAFAIEWLAKWSDGTSHALKRGLPDDAVQILQPYCEILQGSWITPQPGDPLPSIFSQVRSPGNAEPAQHYWRPEALSLEPVDPVAEAQARQVDRGALWAGFPA